MSKNNVRVTVNLIDNFSGTLERLERRLDKISKKTITPEFHIKGTKDIENLKLRMESIDEVIETMLQIFGDKKITETKAKIESLSGVENVYIKTHDNELNKTIAKMEALKRKRQIQNQQAAQDDFLNNIARANRRARRHEGAAARTAEAVSEKRGMRRPLIRKSSGGGGRGPGLPRFSGGGDDDDRGPRSNQILKGAHKWLIPKGQLSQDLFAFIMPFMAVMYTAIAGMVATFGATAAAGLSVGLLGLIGFGENAADSLHLAQVRLRLFGRELFNVFKPVTQTFAPIMDAFFRQAPHALGRLTGSFQKLMVFVPALKSHGQGIISWIDVLILKTVDLQPKISQLTSRFGQLTGIKLLDFFEWLVEELYNNQEAIIQVLSVGKSFLLLVYRIFMLWGLLIGVLQPVADLLIKVADIMTNKWVAGATAAIVSATLFGIVLSKLVILMATIGAMGLGSTFMAIVAPILRAAGAMWAYVAAVAAASKIQAAFLVLASAGAGLAIIGASIAAMNSVSSAVPDLSGSGGGFSGGGFGAAPAGAAAGGGNTIIIQGDVDKDEYNKLRDDFPGLYQEERSYETSTEMPGF